MTSVAALSGATEACNTKCNQPYNSHIRTTLHQSPHSHTFHTRTTRTKCPLRRISACARRFTGTGAAWVAVCAECPLRRISGDLSECAVLVRRRIVPLIPIGTWGMIAARGSLACLVNVTQCNKMFYRGGDPMTLTTTEGHFARLLRSPHWLRVE